jgi:integrase/recombinase XerD
MEISQPGPAVSGVVVTTSRVLRIAVAAYLARFKGQSRIHTASDLRGYLVWCYQRDLDPLTVSRPHVELSIRWLQEVRRYRPSTVSRRLSVVAGFYRTA